MRWGGAVSFSAFSPIAERASAAIESLPTAVRRFQDCIKLTVEYVPSLSNLSDDPHVDVAVNTSMIGNPMYKLLAGCAVIAVTAVVMLPVSAGAVERRPDGMRTNDRIEVSSVRRHRRYGYAPRYYARRGYAGPYYAQSYYDRPSYGYGYAQGPGWGPAPFPFVLGLPY
jgi:hypothetical protein